MTDEVLRTQARLLEAFPGGTLHGSGEQIEFCSPGNSGVSFILSSCETEKDVKRKVLEWFSRAAYKTAPWISEKKNREYHERMLAGINAFLGTSFTEQDIETIYTYFGNAIKSRDAEAFIDGGYDMRFFEKYRRAEK